MRMNILCAGVACLLLLGGCAEMQPKTEVVTSEDAPAVEQLAFKAADLEAIKTHARNAIAELKWELLYEGSQPPRGDRTFLLIETFFDADAQAAIATIGRRDAPNAKIRERVQKSGRPVYVIRAKTPTTLTSWGAVVHVFFHASPDEIFVWTTAASNQWAEKAKLPGYVDSFASKLSRLARP